MSALPTVVPFPPLGGPVPVDRDSASAMQSLQAHRRKGTVRQGAPDPACADQAQRARQSSDSGGIGATTRPPILVVVRRRAGHRRGREDTRCVRQLGGERASSSPAGLVVAKRDPSVSGGRYCPIGLVGLRAEEGLLLRPREASTVLSESAVEGGTDHAVRVSDDTAAAGRPRDPEDDGAVGEAGTGRLLSRDTSSTDSRWTRTQSRA